MDIFLLIAAVLSMLATAAIIHLVCRHKKAESFNNRYYLPANKAN